MARTILSGVNIVAAAALALLVSGGAMAAPKAIKAVPKLEAASDDATKQHARVRKLLPAATREKGEAAGKTFASKSVDGLSDAAVLDLARKEAVKIAPGAKDIDALVLLVMMEASRSAEDDLKAMMASMSKVNAAREKLRDEIKRLKDRMKDLKKELAKGKKAPSPAWLKKVASAKTTNLGLAYTVLPEASPTVCEVKDDEECIDELEQKLDSLSDLGEADSLRMQMVMDRRSKFLTALSNILKKTADTADAIISNLK